MTHMLDSGRSITSDMSVPALLPPPAAAALHTLHDTTPVMEEAPVDDAGVSR